MFLSSFSPGSMNPSLMRSRSTISSVEDEACAGIRAQQLGRHLSLGDLIERLASAVQWNDVVSIYLLERCHGLARVVLLVWRKMEPTDHRMDLLDAGNSLSLLYGVDYA